MTMWYARVCLYGEYGDTIKHRQAELTGWQDCAKAAAILLGGEMEFGPPGKPKTVSQPDFEKEFGNTPDTTGTFDCLTMLVADDLCSASIVGDTYYSGVGNSKEKALAAYAQAQPVFNEDGGWK